MIILNYPPFVGGKFISNCLALSRHCVVQDKTFALEDIANRNFNDEYYKFKLDCVLKSLPDKDSMDQWVEFEFGCKQLYGIDEEFYTSNSIKVIKEAVASNEILQKLISNNRQSCLVVHEYKTLLKQLLIYPSAFTIEFVNFREFRLLASKLKSKQDLSGNSGYNLLAEYYAQDQEFYKLDSFQIDVDNAFFDWRSFNSMMCSLYNYLGFDDYNPTLVHRFWSAYIELHNNV